MMPGLQKNQQYHRSNVIPTLILVIDDPERSPLHRHSSLVSSSRHEHNPSSSHDSVFRVRERECVCVRRGGRGVCVCVRAGGMANALCRSKGVF